MACAIWRGMMLPAAGRKVVVPTEGCVRGVVEGEGALGRVPCEVVGRLFLSSAARAAARLLIVCRVRL
jgi:hypothetical protein